jgi:hypothetical protein
VSQATSSNSRRGCEHGMRAQGNEGGKNCDHAHNGMAVARKSLDFSTFRSFEKHRIHGLDVLLSYARSDDPDAGIGQLGLEIALQLLFIPLSDEREVPSNAPNGRNSIAT